MIITSLLWKKNTCDCFQIFTILFLCMLGTAGNSLWHNNGDLFSTKDRDNDRSTINCAQRREGGWWHGSCTLTNLNGRIHEHSGTTAANWQDFKMLDALKYVAMMTCKNT